MSFWDFLKRKAPITEVKAEEVLEKRRLQISEHVREKLNQMGEPFEQRKTVLPVRTQFDIVPYTPPAGVAPASHVLAMDAAVNIQGFDLSMFTGGGFPGFAYLTELAQLTEYRDMSERIAAEMTRKWIKLRSTDEEDRSEEIKKLEAEMRRLKLRDLFRRMAELDGLFGRGQLFIDLGDDQGQELTKPLLVDKLKIKKDRLRGVRVVEPINTYPQTYNSTNPLAADYYNPSMWYVQGQAVHASRLLTFASRPLPNMLKPTYNFSGMSLSQLAQPYVDYWYSTRDSVGKLLRNFSTSILKTNMADVLAGGTGQELIARAKMYTKLRDNQGLFIMDKDMEDFAQINTPLGGLSQLQSQAQEHMAAVAKTPLIILLGVSPTGLNASSEGEIRVFYDYIAECQEKLFRPNLEILLKILQLSLFGEVYDDITFDFVSLFAMTDAEKATIRLNDSQAGCAYITAGVIDTQEERERIAKDPSSGYDNLDLSKKIEKPMPIMAPGQNPSMSGGSEGKDKPAAATKPVAKPKEEKVTDELPTFFGNQHTGALGSMEDTNHAMAVMASSVASKATMTATMNGTKRSHERALQAHERALAAQQAALEDHTADAFTPVYEEYIKSHEALINVHEAAIKSLQAKIDSWSDK